MRLVLRIEAAGTSGNRNFPLRKSYHRRNRERRTQEKSCSIAVHAVTIRSRPRGGSTTFVLREHLAQVVYPVGGEGDGLLVVGAVNPEAAILRLHVDRHVPQQLFVLAEDFGGTADGDCGSRLRHVRRRGRQGSPGANSTVAARPGR